MCVLINNLVDFCRLHRWYLVAGLVGLLMLEMGLVIVEKPGIESDIASRASVILKQRGYGRIAVVVDGREVALNGAVSSRTAEKLAVEYSKSIYGVGSVTSQLQITPLRLPHLIISRDLNRDLKLEGEVPAQNLVDQFVELAKSTISHDSFVNFLHANPEVADPIWVGAVEGIMQEGNRLLSMNIEIGAGRLALGGLMDRESDYNVLIKRVQQFTSEQQLLFVNKIGIRPAPGYFVEAELESSESEASQPEMMSVEKYTRPARSMDVEVDITQEKSKLPNDDLVLEKCQSQLNTSLVAHPITFTSDSAKISVNSYTNIEIIYKLLMLCPTFAIFIEGHTDSRGNLDTNKLLSDRRAYAVMGTMIALGVESGRISAQGFGASRPVASNETATGRQQNRRIEMILTLK